MEMLRPMDFQQKRCPRCGQMMMKDIVKQEWYCPSCYFGKGLGRGLPDIDGIDLQFM